MLLKPSFRSLILFTRPCVIPFCRKSFARITAAAHEPGHVEGDADSPVTAKKQLACIREHLRKGDSARALGAILKPPSDVLSRSSWYDKCTTLLLSRNEVPMATRVVIKALGDGVSLPNRILREVLGGAAHFSYQAWPSQVQEDEIEDEPVMIEQSVKNLYSLHQRLLEIRSRAEIIKWLNSYARDHDLDWANSAAITSIFIRASMASNEYKAAYRWFHRYRRRVIKSADSEDALAWADPYLALMSSHAYTYPVDLGFQQRILRMLIKDRVLPTLPIFNISMSTARRANQPRVVYNLYSLLRTHASHLVPDSFTFATLFKTMDRFNPDSRHPDLPDARHIFRHLIDTHLFIARGDPTFKTRTMTVSVLNVALRHFMRVRQYSAALVVLRCFEMCDLLPDKRTEWIIHSFVLRRINGELYARYPFECGVDSSRPTWAELFTATILHAQFRGDSANPDLMNSAVWSSFSSDRERVERQLGADVFAFVKANRPRLSKLKVARQLNSTQRPVTSIPEQNDEGESKTEETTAQDGGVWGSLDLLVSTVRNCAIAELGIRPSTQTQTQRDAKIRQLMLERDRTMFPRRPGGKVRKRPFRRPMLDKDGISHGLQGESANIGDRDEDYDTS